MKLNQKFAIGIDLGATTVKAGIVSTTGIVVDQISADAKANHGPSAVIQQISFVIQELLGKHKNSNCIGIGIGAPGMVSAVDSFVHHPPNFTDWSRVDVGGEIRKKFKLHVEIENDANCAAVAEARFGVGVEFKNFLFVIWGTGVGGGIILNRKIFRGPNGGAGEIGHVSIDYNGRLCNCGNYGCIESYIGQRYLSQRTKEILRNIPADRTDNHLYKLVGGNLNKIEPSIISQAAELGDPIAISILEEAGTLLGAALASTMNVIDVSVVVIGGGVSAVPAFVYDAVIKSLRSRVLKPHKDNIHVLRAKLGNTAGIIGSASLVM
ncbi:MAG: ROK family protein [Ignavibacteriales bacterium]|nr:ROK family protein [Ignavibacteriales bacterium]